MLLRQLRFMILAAAFGRPLFAMTALGLELNPKLGLTAQPSALHSERGFVETYAHGDIEVVIKGTKFREATTAKQMTRVEFNNLVKLYAPRGNPYIGQITDLIECAPQFKPHTFSFKIGSEEVNAVVAGVSERKLFGACTREQVGYWGGYLSFYHAPSQMVIEARLFRKALHPAPAQLPNLTNEMKKLAQSLFLSKGT